MTVEELSDRLHSAEKKLEDLQQKLYNALTRIEELEKKNEGMLTDDHDQGAWFEETSPATGEPLEVDFETEYSPNYHPIPYFNQSVNVPFSSPFTSATRLPMPTQRYSSQPNYLSQRHSQKSYHGTPYRPMPSSSTYQQSLSSIVPDQSSSTYEQSSSILPDQSVSRCLQIRYNSSAMIGALPSSSVDRKKLTDPTVTLQKYYRLNCPTHAGTLAMKLARESFFGDQVLLQCTVMGNREYPALPMTELAELKQLVFSLFPQYWGNAVEFETTWKRCTDAIGQACARLKRVGN